MEKILNITCWWGNPGITFYSSQQLFHGVFVKVDFLFIQSLHGTLPYFADVGIDGVGPLRRRKSLQST